MNADQPGAPPARLTTAEVCARARISRASLWRRVACGRLPAPIDQARQALFCAAAIERALSIHAAPEPSALERAIADKIARRRQRHDSA
jgi:predicted DNA-binding transcriptional regulator AlpA